MKDYSVLLPCGESTMVVIHDAFDKGYQQGYEDGKKSSCDCKDNMESEYIRGLNEAWEFVQKLVKDACDGGYTASLLQNVFGYCNISSIVLRYDINEAIVKIKEYEERQKQDTEIKVGDEVKDKIGYIGIVITDKPSREDEISVLFSEFEQVQLVCKSDLVKTGRHFPQIAEVLAEMRGDSE